MPFVDKEIGNDGDCDFVLRPTFMCAELQSRHRHTRRRHTVVDQREAGRIVPLICKVAHDGAGVSEYRVRPAQDQPLDPSRARIGGLIVIERATARDERLVPRDRASHSSDNGRTGQKRVHDGWPATADVDSHGNRMNQISNEPAHKRRQPHQIVGRDVGVDHLYSARAQSVADRSIHAPTKCFSG